MELQGSFFEQRREEILNLVKNEEKLEKGEHPLERIMQVRPADGHILITTTGVHLARRIGDAVVRAYQGDLTFTYGDDEKTVRVKWLSR